MYLNQQILEAIRKSELKIHCLSIRIWQEMEDGIKLSGHGTIQQNKLGTLYIEFVCTEAIFPQGSGSRTRCF